MMVSEVASRRGGTLQDEKQIGIIEEGELKESHASESSFLKGNGTSLVVEEKVSTVKINSVPDPPFVMNMQLNVVWLVLLGLSFGTRLWQLTIPKYVVFDEVHFGKFTNFFMQNKFFFDVHPPLGKLTFAITAYLSGYDGSFSFDEIGQAIRCWSTDA
ncbi:dolichyl-phosphate-mannose--protein mannosyltransferase 4-like [Actinia tenebrosa]|uniref:Dolichyl-phosphate-mannose--protein mannosyltransferase 4-like n=1 Tax=Actinia tenebrosa TaxID=6105 RepID=A0A6P8H9Z8_ACTTE|nr:dolichyl-phosphate-mannose--protein mannosyltransferase 4-like [Actinia tenebrosa]